MMDEFSELRRSLRKPTPGAPPPPRPGASPGQLAPDDPARYFQADPGRTRPQISPLWAVAAIAALIVAVLLFTPDEVRRASQPVHAVETPQQQAERLCRNVYHATYQKPIAQLSLQDTNAISHCEAAGLYKP